MCTFFFSFKIIFFVMKKLLKMLACVPEDKFPEVNKYNLP